MKKDYFEKYASNTLGGSSNQFFFDLNAEEIRTGRVFYKIFTAGEYNYSFLFSNIIDSTYADGVESWANLICGEWEILSAKVGVAQISATDKDASELILSDTESSDIHISQLRNITFERKTDKKVEVGEIFVSDPIALRFEEGEYLCLEITFSGEKIPYHEEISLPIFVKNKQGWEYSRRMPVPNMVGCDRKVRQKIAFLGDSITQGIGVRCNSYLHWNSLLAEKIGKDYAFWNLGIGYGRAIDVASGGIWLQKAMQNDVVFICLGVNDLLQGGNASQIKEAIKIIAQKIKQAGKKVILQTVPPFNYNEKTCKEWKQVNRFIKVELSKMVDFVFDVVPVLQVSEEQSHLAKFGGHPNEDGCALWAEKLYKKIVER